MQIVQTFYHMKTDDLDRDASYFRGKHYFDNDGAQNVLDQFLVLLKDQDLILAHGNQQVCMVIVTL